MATRRTIFITSFHPFISRNILSTDILTFLAREGMRVIIFCPDYKKEYFIKNFGAQDINIEGVSLDGSSKKFHLLFFKRLARAMFGMKTARIARSGGTNSWFRKIFLTVFFYAPAAFLGRYALMRKLMRMLDHRFARNYTLSSFFNLYNPSVVFSTDVQNEYDVLFMREARYRKIPVIGMVRSWDNLTVHGLLRIHPDILLVGSERLKKQAWLLHDMPAEHIKIVGVPHYDSYIRGPTISGCEFFKTINGDPKKPLVLFAPIGDMYVARNFIDRYVLDALHSLDISVLVRLPPTDIVSLGDVSSYANVFFYQPGASFRNGVYGDREITREDDNHLINALFYSQVVVVTGSTVSIDAIVFDKPTVIVGFDVDQEGKTRSALGRLRMFDHLAYLYDTGAFRIALSREDLLAQVKTYLAHPEYERAERIRLFHEQCGGCAGKSSQNVLDALLFFADRALPRGF